jgi:hypothetical protein
MKSNIKFLFICLFSLSLISNQEVQSHTLSNLNSYCTYDNGVLDTFFAERSSGYLVTAVDWNEMQCVLHSLMDEVGVNPGSGGSSEWTDEGTVLRPTDAADQWIRINGSASGPKWGSVASNVAVLDLDNDNVGDLQLSLSALSLTNTLDLSSVPHGSASAPSLTFDIITDTGLNYSESGGNGVLDLIVDGSVVESLTDTGVSFTQPVTLDSDINLGNNINFDGPLNNNNIRFRPITSGVNSLLYLEDTGSSPNTLMVFSDIFGNISYRNFILSSSALSFTGTDPSLVLPKRDDCTSGPTTEGSLCYDNTTPNKASLTVYDGTDFQRVMTYPDKGRCTTYATTRNQNGFCLAATRTQFPFGNYTQCNDIFFSAPMHLGGCIYGLTFRTNQDIAASQSITVSLEKSTSTPGNAATDGAAMGALTWSSIVSGSITGTSALNEFSGAIPDACWTAGDSMRWLISTANPAEQIITSISGTICVSDFE